MTSGAKPINRRSNLIKQHYLGMKRDPHCFSKFFLAIILLEIIANVSGFFFQNFTFVDPSDYNIDQTLKITFVKVGDLVAAYLMPLTVRCVVFEI